MTAYESAFAIAVNDHPLSLASARQQSHDQVIANTGPARRSGVTWYHAPVATAARDLAATSDIILPPEVLAVMDRFPGGVLVLATVEVDPEVPSPGGAG